MIYFLEAGHRGPIKIGWCRSADSVLARRSTIQTGNPEPVYILRLMHGDRGIERGLHARFAHARRFGGQEWFNPVPELLRFIEDTKDTDPQLPAWPDGDALIASLDAPGLRWNR